MSPSRTVRSGDVKFGPDGAENAAAMIIDRYTKAGISLNPGTRLILARDLVRDVNSGAIKLRSDDVAMLRRLGDVHVTLIEHTLISDLVSEAASPPTQQLILKIKQSLSGAESEDADVNQLARSTQFELFVVAMLAVSQVPVGFGAADLVIRFDSRDACVAAKRLNSPGKIIRRAKEASRQIRDSRLPGFVAINLDRVRRLDGISPLEDASIPSAFPALRRADEFLRLEAAPHVLGRMAFVREVFWDISRTPPRMHIKLRTHFASFTSTPEEERAGSQFFLQIQKAVTWRFDRL